MTDVQSGILAPLPAAGPLPQLQRPAAGRRCAPRCARCANWPTASAWWSGLGESLVRALGREIPGLHSFAGAVGPGLELPATPAALWCWLRGDDRGDLVHLTRSCRPRWTVRWRWSR